MDSFSVPVTSSLVLLAVLAVLVARYPDRGINTSSSRGIPGPKGLPLLGNLVQIVRQRHDVAGWLKATEGMFGPLFTYSMVGYGRAVVINHAIWVDHVQKKDMASYGKSKHALGVLTEFFGRFNPVVAEGELWRTTRKLAANVLTYKAFDRDVSRAMGQILPVAVEMLSTAAAKDMVVDWSSFSGRIALTIFFHLAFRVDPEALTADPKCLDEPNRIVEAVRTCNSVAASRLHNPLWRLTEKFDGRGKRAQDAQTYLWDKYDKIIEERLEQQKRGEIPEQGDFLTELLRSVQSKELAREGMFALLFAGQENLLNIMCWSLYELSQRPQWIQRMRQEAQENNPTGAIAHYNSMQSYPIHLAVFYESLRLWPGIPRNSRVAKEDDVLPAIPSLGYGPVLINKGDVIIWDDHAIMRRTDVWGEDANVFNPGRHLDQDGKFVKPSVPHFHGFGSGPRQCPGAALATYEFVVIWTTLLPLFDIIPLQNKERYMMPGISSTMDGPLLVKLQQYS